MALYKVFVVSFSLGVYIIQNDDINWEFFMVEGVAKGDKDGLSLDLVCLLELSNLDYYFDRRRQRLGLHHVSVCLLGLSNLDYYFGGRQQRWAGAYVLFILSRMMI